MYPSDKALKRPEVKAFVDYVVENYQAIAEASQIVPHEREPGRRGQDGARELGGSRFHNRSDAAARRHPASARLAAAGART